jgi:hypothetical protein
MFYLFYLLPTCFEHLDMLLDFKIKPRAEITFFSNSNLYEDIYELNYNM